MKASMIAPGDVICVDNTWYIVETVYHTSIYVVGSETPFHSWQVICTI